MSGVNLTFFKSTKKVENAFSRHPWKSHNKIYQKTSCFKKISVTFSGVFPKNIEKHLKNEKITYGFVGVNLSKPAKNHENFNIFEHFYHQSSKVISQI